MAICRKFRKPDLFLTFTCNTKWEEITRELREGEIVQDRPDLVARVFKLKKDQLMNDIKSGNVFGKVPAFLWVIEFQKRGLPHTHILVILDEEDRLTTSSDVDNVISAQLPPDPNLFEKGSDEYKQAERLESTILKNMIHGPCGKLNPKSPCMQDGICSKGYPKPFCDKTVINSDKTYPEYQRLSPEDGGRKIIHQGFELNNSWVVPYSPYISLRFGGHANLEVCMSFIAPKYLFKYVTKGEDRAMVRAEVVEGNDTVRDEIEEYVDLRSVGSSEASWHLFNFNISQNKPAVYALRVHLENEQQIVFDMGSEEQSLERQQFTELTGFFNFNEENPETRIKYVDFPESLTWNTGKKQWNWRKNVSDTIGRIHSVHPAAGEVYYLRMLLHHDHSKGKRSFEHLKSVDGVVQESYQEVCRQLGLLQDDREWDEALAEGALTAMPSSLRELYVIIVLFCMPANPKELFNNHYNEWADDFKAGALRKNIVLTEAQIRTLVLLDIKHRLQSWDRDINIINIPQPTNQELEDVAFTYSSNYPVLIQEELEFDVNILKEIVAERKEKFTKSQSDVFNKVMAAVTNESPLCLFVDARGGTGKTYVLNGILAAVRVLDGGSVALAVGSTGIAANLLHLGRTFHSRFKVPLNINSESVCNIDTQSALAKLICMAKVIVWDEAPMNHRHQLEALDRTLRDLTSIDSPFGGKTVVLSGDFRQCLPVLPHANRAQVVDAALNRSSLWKCFEIMELTQNMRILLSQDSDIKGFDEFTLKLGNGEMEVIEDSDLVQIPEEMCFRIEANTKENPNGEKQSMQRLAYHIYPDMHKNYNKPGWMDGRAILAPTNNQVSNLNNLLADKFPGKPIVLTSSDEVVNPDDFARYNSEYLNSLSPNGLPNHRLFIKPGMPLMLLRNLNPKMGLCNGTRLIFLRLHKNHLLECKIVGGEYKDRKVLIPRITLRPKDREYPFEWSRRQFPVRISFAMTINKSQGQTLQNVGVWLHDSCFAHGQLYVAMSRVGSPKHIKFSLPKVNGHNGYHTSNVVYKEVLIRR